MYGPVRTVVWQGSAGDRRPYADLVGFEDMRHRKISLQRNGPEADFGPASTGVRPCPYIQSRPRLANNSLESKAEMHFRAELVSTGQLTRRRFFAK